MRRLSVVLAGSALAISAHAVNWIEISETDSGSTFSLDSDSIESSDINIIDEHHVENILASIRRTYPPQLQQTDKKDKKSKKESAIDHSDQQLLISCKDASYYRRAYVNYGADNKVIKSWQSDKPILTTKDFKVTTPKTIGRKIVEQTCERYQQDK
ncbi:MULTISPECIES: hypothetical protein [Psychrobacter]|jgi:hypothetical protein|uniref:hypothetical protein n=1 Tax=Psychrobacter TaxID=497 RepID=UPI001918D36E|nr:hypothetical protein [Psychrobacter immobilis]